MDNSDNVSIGNDQKYAQSIAQLDELKENFIELKRLLEEHKGLGERFRAPYYYLGGNRGLTYLETGQPIFVNTADCALTPWLIMGGHWETWADEILSAYVKPGMNIVDVGANVGYYAVKWGALIGPAGRLHAFEPNPELTQFIYENFSLNGLHGRCRLHPCAVGSASGTAVLTFTDHNTGMGTLRTTELPPGTAKTYEVKVEPLDKLLTDLEYVDLMKIDVEGFEPAVLAGAHDLINRSPKCAFHLEVQTTWEETFGCGLDEVLLPLTEARCIFVLGHDRTLRPISFHDVREYVFRQPGGMADIFLCPPEDQFLDTVRHFLRPL